MEPANIGLSALQRRDFPLSCTDGVKCTVLLVEFPSSDTLKVYILVEPRIEKILENMMTPSDTKQSVLNQLDR